MNILIYDSDKDVQHLLKSFVESLNHNGLIANTPISMLLTPPMQSYDLIISEYLANEGNLLDVFKRIKMKKPLVPIVVLTTLELSLREFHTLNELGIVHIFQKPVSTKIISDAIQSCINEQNESKMLYIKK